MNEVVKKTFTLASFLFVTQENCAITPWSHDLFLDAKELCSYLVRVKLHPLERFASSFKCENKCNQLCLSVFEIHFFTSFIKTKSIKLIIVFLLQ